MSFQEHNTSGSNPDPANLGPAANVDFNVSLNFRVRAVIGKGPNSIVCLAIHLPSGAQVAITRYEPYDSPLFYRRILKEIFLLRKFEHSKHVTSLLGVQKPDSLSTFHEVYLIREFLELDLYGIIQTRRLRDLDCQYYVDQILRGLRYIHSAGIIHCDLRPSKIMVNAVGQVKIRGFGSARLADPILEGEVDIGVDDSTPPLAESVATGWYQSPELLLDANHILPSIDLWLVGCIMGEMYAFAPLFPGITVPYQLDLIFAMLGSPNSTELSWITSEQIRRRVQSMQYQQGGDITQVLGSHPLRKLRVGDTPINASGIDLLKSLLVFNPLLRTTTDNAMKHEYLSAFHGKGRHSGDVRVFQDEFHSAMGFGTTTAEELKEMAFESLSELNSI